jgi:arginine transport system substrate-binding protein
VDLAHLVAQKMGKKLVIRDMDFDGVIIALNQGKIDLIMSSMNITPSRTKEIFMIPYHGEATDHFTLIFWNKIPDNVHSIEDLAKIPGASICAEVGSVHEEYINRYKKIISVKSFPGILNTLIDVKYGKSQALLVEPDVAGYLKKKNSEIKTIPIFLPPDVIVGGSGIGVSKKNKALYEEVSHIIQELKASGELQKIEDKWFGGQVE